MSHKQSVQVSKNGSPNGHSPVVRSNPEVVPKAKRRTPALPRAQRGASVNQLCHTALMAGLIDQKSILEENTIRKAIADIDHD